MALKVFRSLSTLQTHTRTITSSLDRPKSNLQHSLPCTYYRGGTSRALFFHLHHLPQPKHWPQLFRGILGSPDPHGRQLDGMGGGISSLSKICVVSPSTRPDADVDFKFAAVDVKSGEVDMGAACGNMSAAVGPWAVDEGVVAVSSSLVCEFEGEREVTVRIFDTNTCKYIHSTFPVTKSKSGAFVAATAGTFAMDGVTGTASPNRLSFLHPSGSKTGKLLPTGLVAEKLDGTTCTLIDVGNPAVFVHAKAFPELPALEKVTPEVLEDMPELRERLETLRCIAARRMGIIKSEGGGVPVGYPKISIVAKSTGQSEMDVIVRSMSVGQPHKAIPITTALAVAAAARIPGSIVHDIVPANNANDTGLTIGHASGSVVVGSRWNSNGELMSADVFRTARRIMEGRVFYR